MHKIRYDLEDFELLHPYNIVSMEQEGERPYTLHLYKNQEGKLLLSTSAIYINISNTEKYAFYRPQEVYEIRDNVILKLFSMSIIGCYILDFIRKRMIRSAK